MGKQQGLSEACVHWVLVSASGVLVICLRFEDPYTVTSLLWLKALLTHRHHWKSTFLPKVSQRDICFPWAILGIHGPRLMSLVISFDISNPLLIWDIALMTSWVLAIKTSVTPGKYAYLCHYLQYQLYKQPRHVITDKYEQKKCVYILEYYYSTEKKKLCHSQEGGWNLE